jgi:hypothetical protein
MATASNKWGASGSRLILMLSSERSGSTLLRVMLGQHSRVVAPSELWLMHYPDYEAWRQGWPPAIESVLEYLHLVGRPMAEAELEKACKGQSTLDIYRWMLDRLVAGSFLIDKTPAYANSIETLERSRAFAPYYIWLIRHPLGVIDSYVRLKQERSNFRGLRLIRRKILDQIERYRNAGMTSLAKQREVRWVQQQENINQFLSTVSHSQKSCVRFEDLVSDPKGTLTGLCEQIGLAWEEGVLSPALKSMDVRRGIGDARLGSRDKIEASVANEWTERFNERMLGPKTLDLVEKMWTRGLS